jgi:hypothetical protein
MTTPNSQAGIQPKQGTPGASGQPHTSTRALRAAAAFLESTGQRNGVIVTCSTGGIRIRVTEPYADAATRQAILGRLAGLIGGTIRQEDDRDFAAADLKTAGVISGLPTVAVTGVEVRRTQSHTRTGLPLAEAPDGVVTAVRGKLPDGWRWVTELDPQPSLAASCKQSTADTALPAGQAAGPAGDGPLLTGAAGPLAGPQGHATAIQPAEPRSTAQQAPAQPPC